MTRAHCELAAKPYSLYMACLPFIFGLFFILLRICLLRTAEGKLTAYDMGEAGFFRYSLAWLRHVCSDFSVFVYTA